MNPSVGTRPGQQTTGSGNSQRSCSHWPRKKTHLAAALVWRGGFPVKRVTDALAVSRSNTYERSRSPRPRPERYSKAEDAFLLPLIVELLVGRQTYGYRGIQRLLNRQLVAGGRTPVNHKRVYRIIDLTPLRIPLVS